MRCRQCLAADYVPTAAPAIWACPGCGHTIERVGPRLHPVAQAALTRLAQTVARAGARGLAAAADSALEEGEELVENLLSKGEGFLERMREARKGRNK